MSHSCKITSPSRSSKTIIVSSIHYTEGDPEENITEKRELLREFVLEQDIQLNIPNISTDESGAGLTGQHIDSLFISNDDNDKKEDKHVIDSTSVNVTTEALTNLELSKNIARTRRNSIKRRKRANFKRKEKDGFHRFG